MNDYNKNIKQTRKMIELFEHSKTFRRLAYSTLAVIVLWAVLYNLADIITAVKQ